MASTKLEFRVAMPEDAALIQPLVRSAYRGEESRKGWTTEADLVTGERIDVAGIRAKIEDPNGRILMTTNEDGVLVACCEILRLNDDIAYFGLFAVDPQRQGGGLGRQVLKYAEDYCFREWEVQKLEMMVIGTRDELISWYVRRGYQKTGETRPFPYEHLVNDTALRDDLYMTVLEKELGAILSTAVAA